MPLPFVVLEVGLLLRGSLGACIFFFYICLCVLAKYGQQGQLNGKSEGCAGLCEARHARKHVRVVCSFCLLGRSFLQQVLAGSWNKFTIVDILFIIFRYAHTAGSAVNVLRVADFSWTHCWAKIFETSAIDCILLCVYNIEYRTVSCVCIKTILSGT